MDGWLRQSTAVTVPIGPLVDDADGNTEETGLTVAQADVRLSKNGAASAQKNNSSSATHDADGVYLCPLSTTDTNTLGQIVLWVHVSGALFAKHVFHVVPAQVWDSFFSTDLLQVDAREFAGVTAVSGAIPAVAAGANGGLPTGDASGRVLLQPTQTGVTIPTVTTLTGHTGQTGDAFARLGAPAGASVSADVAAVKADTGNLVTRITSGLFTGITSLAQWLGLIAGKQVGNTTARTELRATGAGSGTYDETTDSQEALKDDQMTAVELENAVLDATTASHATAGSIGKAIADASSAGDPWSTALPGAYGAGTAGKLIGDNINATISSRATPAQVATELATYDGPTNAEMVARTLVAADYATATNQATIIGYLDTEIAAIIASLGTIAGYLDTEIAAIKAKTDNLPTDPADASDVAAAIAALNNVSATDILTQVNAAINASISELGVAAPSATPTIRTALMLLYMNLRNRTTTTATAETIQNDAGTTIATAALSDDGTTFTKGEFA